MSQYPNGGYSPHDGYDVMIARLRSDPATYQTAIGAVFLLFTVGLETSPKDLIRVGRVAATVAAAGVVVPFAFGFLYLIWRNEPAHEATFVAAAMVVVVVVSRRCLMVRLYG